MPEIYKATISGNLRRLDQFRIVIPGAGSDGGNGTVYLNNLPEISDSKNASYNEDPLPGRSSPLMTYSSSGVRLISMKLHFVATQQSDVRQNAIYLRMLQSATYPREGTSVSGLNGVASATPYLPPPVCEITCGQLLAEGPLYAVLESYSVSFDPQVAWDPITYFPYKFDVDTSWKVVYLSAAASSGSTRTDLLPWQGTIVKSRYSAG